MSVTTTYAHLVLNDQLPPGLRDYNSVLDKNTMMRLLKAVAKKAPESYSTVVDTLMSIGNRHATFYGKSFKYDTEFEKSPDRDRIVKAIEAGVFKVLKSGLPQAKKDDRLRELFHAGGKELEAAAVASGKKKDSYLHSGVVSGAKGNVNQLRMVNEAVVGVMDHRDRPVPVTIKASYAEGLPPSEFFAATYGARKGLMSTKMSTADTGAFEKSLVLMNIGTVITEQDCNTRNGLIRPVEDSHTIDRFLGASAGPYPAGTLVTNEMLSVLKKKRVTHLKIRSPMTCEAEGGGLCSMCFGHNELGRRPGVGENVGVNAAQAVSEPLTQMALNAKHTGGAIGTRSVVRGGFPAASQLLKVPKKFPDGAPLSPSEGLITKIVEAPQGGTYVHVDDKRLYVQPGLALKVKKGDRVTAGQALSEGLVNPAELASLVGIGAARDKLQKDLRGIFNAAGQDPPARHFEIIAKNMLNFGQVTDPGGGNLPGDVFKFSGMKEINDPRKREVSVDVSMGKYLAHNYNQHTIGTKINSKVVRDLKLAGFTKVTVVDAPPAFSPKVVSVESAPLQDPDFMVRLGSRHLKDTLEEAAQFGMTTRVHGTTNPIPAYAYGAEFGVGTSFY